MRWPQITALWNKIKRDAVVDWEEGAALEHVIVRALALSGLDVEYRYEVPPGGRRLEQIDGIAYLEGLVFLPECKDKSTVDIEAIAKLHHRLSRRPNTALGCVFITGDFSEPALTLADYALPHRILLWSGDDIETAIRDRDFKTTLIDKYRNLCKHGMTDHSPNFRTLKV